MTTTIRSYLECDALLPGITAYSKSGSKPGVSINPDAQPNFMQEATSKTVKYLKINNYIMFKAKLFRSNLRHHANSLQVQRQEGLACIPEKVQLPATVQEIFNIEFSFFGLPHEQRSHVTGKYASHVSTIMESISTSKKDEKKLFMEIARILRSKLKVTFEEDSTLIRSATEKSFNCYSSVVLVSDVLQRIGNKVEIIISPGHILLAGSTHAFETTSAPEYAAFHRSFIKGNYPVHWKLGVEKLVGPAWNNIGVMLLKEGKIMQALPGFERSLKINPSDTEAMYNIGTALCMQQKYEDAIAVYRKILEINPHDDVVAQKVQHILSHNDQKSKMPAASQEMPNLRM